MRWTISQKKTNVPYFQQEKKQDTKGVDSSKIWVLSCIIMVRMQHIEVL